MRSGFLNEVKRGDKRMGWAPHAFSKHSWFSWGRDWDGWNM